MNLRLISQYIICTKFKMTALEQIRDAIHPEQWAV